MYKIAARREVWCFGIAHLEFEKFVALDSPKQNVVFLTRTEILSRTKIGFWVERPCVLKFFGMGSRRGCAVGCFPGCLFLPGEFLRALSLKKIGEDVESVLDRDWILG